VRSRPAVVGFDGRGGRLSLERARLDSPGWALAPLRASFVAAGLEIAHRALPGFLGIAALRWCRDPLAGPSLLRQLDRERLRLLLRFRHG
jgi:hypothetical protein